MAIPPIQINLTSSLSSFDTKNLPKLLIAAEGYESKEITPYKGDGTAKTDLGVISLTPTNIALEQDKIKASQLNTTQIKELSKGTKSPDYFAKERLSNQIDNIKSTLIPIVLTLIAEFGLTKATELLSKNQSDILDKINNKSFCPPQEKLLSIINKKNKLVKQLNNNLTLINNTTISLDISDGVKEVFDKAYNSLKNIPIPSSTGVPGVPGLPLNVILAVQDNKNKILTVVDKLGNIDNSTLTILDLLRQVLLQVIQLLNLLDNLVQKCYPEADQEQISAELTSLTLQQSPTSPTITNVNGFKMGVETEKTEKTLKRRRAIAQNSNGVIILTGEWSFSSIDQILIDELVFYIQQNDLKAY